MGTNAKKYFVGIDLGTTSSKVLLCDSEGSVQGIASENTAVYSSGPEIAESDPNEWWGAISRCLRKVIADAGILAEDIGAVSLCGFSHSPVFLSSEGEVCALSPLWSDSRCKEQGDELLDFLKDEEWIKMIPLITLPTAPKVRWMTEHEPEVMKRTAHVLFPKDYIRYKLTGTIRTDGNEAFGSLYVTPTSDGWAEKIINWSGLTKEQLPKMVSSLSLAGTVTAAAASETGLAEGTPVAVGTVDAPACVLGVGAFLPETACVYLGTAGWCNSFASLEEMNRVGAVSCIGMTSCMGLAYEWVCKLFNQGQESMGKTYERMNEVVGTVPPGADGLLFAPHLIGERGNPVNSSAKGYFFGLTPNHGSAHMARAVMEGALFCLKRSIELSGNKIEAKQLIPAGGGLRNKVWRQMMADIFRIPVAVPKVYDSGAYGAAMLGAVAAGYGANVKEIADRWVQIEEVIEPDSCTADRYEEIYQRYKTLDEGMEPYYELDGKK